MTDTEFEDHIYQLVQAVTSNFENYEATSTLNQHALLTQSLPGFDAVLLRCNMKELYTFCPIIKELLTKRACLLSSEILQQHLDMLCQIMTQKCDQLGMQEQYYAEFSHVLAISYRFLLQISYYEGEPRNFDFIFEKLQGKPSEIKIALSTLALIVEDIKNNPYQLMENQHINFKSFFYKSRLRQYFECTFQYLDNPVGPYIQLTLRLLLSCLKFTTHNEDMLMFKFNVPGDWFDFYTDPTFPQKLFMIYAQNNNDNCNKALDALLYFSSAVDTTWKAIDQHIAFIKTIAEQLTEAIRAFNPEESQKRKADLEFSRLICKIGMVLPLQQFISDGSAADFFEAVKEYSIQHFDTFDLVISDTNSSQSSDSIICGYIITFWWRTATACAVSPGSYGQELLSTFPEIFDRFVSCYLDNIIADEEHMKTYAEGQIETLVSYFEHLWGLVTIAPDECIGILVQKIEEAIAALGSEDSVEAALIRLSALVLMIASRFSIRSNSYYRSNQFNPVLIQQKATLIKNVFDAMEATGGDTLGSLVSNFPLAACQFELSLIEFAKTFKRDMFATNNDAPQVYAELGFGEEGRKFAFDLFVNRFIDDLIIFQGIFNVRYTALLYIDDISRSEKNLTSTNERIQNLINRSFIINLEEFDGSTDDSINQQRKLITLLNSIYARNITSIDNLKVFLSYIDEKFESLSKLNPPFSELVPIFVIFNEIRGILKGCAQIPLFVFTARWYLNNYVDVAAQCIELYGNQPSVCKAIIQSWKCVASNKGRKLMFPPSSFDGIRVFKASLVIVQATLQNVQDSDLQFSIVSLINSSITQTYCNFGVMRYFGDTAQDSMVETLFDILLESNFSSSPKDQLAVASAIASSVKYFADKVLTNDNYRKAAFAFLQECLQKEFDPNNNELWKRTCAAITECLLCGITNPDYDGLADELNAHFVILLDQIINSQSSLVDIACAPLYLMMIAARDFTVDVFGQIVQAFDPENQPKVDTIVQKLLSNLPPEDKAPLDPPKRFRFALSEFKIEMVRFPISVQTIPAFAELLGQA